MAQQPVAVTVTVGVGISVDDSKVKVKKGVDTVEWKATSNNQQFGIVMPSGEPTPSCGWQGHKWVCTAGPFSGDPRTIKYDVTAEGTPPLDPEIEVQP